ncbi:hypothetical protein Acsp05_35100 [Actinokineospora sp. NBRC 105648]|nr:hypothetical protein Acsp05_35100 [Actinokineospora sp. NBRC 105648]
MTGVLAVLLLPGTANATQSIIFTKVGPFQTNEACVYSKNRDIIEGQYLIYPGLGADCDHEASGYYYHSGEWQNG